MMLREFYKKHYLERLYMDKQDTKLAQTNGAIEEVNSLIDFVNTARIDEVTLRGYIQERIDFHQTQLETSRDELLKQKESLEAKTE